MNKTTILMFFLISIQTMAQRPFITVWNTELSGTTANNQIHLHAEGTYQYVWTEINNPSNTGSGTATDCNLYTFPSPGIYEIKITPTGADPIHRYFSYSPDHDGDYEKLIKMTQWGDISWSSFQDMFYSPNTDFEIEATDIPDLTRVTNMKSAFYGYPHATIPNIDQWDVSNVSQMERVFSDSSFNQDIGNWDVSNATTMKYMFGFNTHFNQDWKLGCKQSRKHGSYFCSEYF